jgi:hypothetical protein
MKGDQLARLEAFRIDEAELVARCETDNQGPTAGNSIPLETRWEAPDTRP